MVEWWRERFSLFVGNIPKWGTGDLVRTFSVAGVVFDSFIPTERSAKRRNSAFVRFKLEAAANRTINMLDGKVFEGRKIHRSTA